jgi:hypothetical protein
MGDRWLSRGDGWLSREMSAKKGRWLAKKGKWVAKFVAHLFATAALWVRIQADISQKYKMGDICNINLARQNIYIKNNSLPL